MTTTPDAASTTPAHVAVVTGAGSGVGRAVALALTAARWRVAIVGRRADRLAETIRLAAPHTASIVPFACDVGDPDAVAAMGRDVLALGKVDILVNAAGTNVPRRQLHELSRADYHRMIATNLNGPYYCTQVFLPGMRERRSGTIVNVVSEAGKLATAKAGPAYVMSKFGLAGFTQSVNAEERANGIRTCAVFPGDIDTPLLDQRPAPPDAAARAHMLTAADVAACVLFCITLPPHVVVEEMVVRPR